MAARSSYYADGGYRSRLERPREQKVTPERFASSVQEAVDQAEEQGLITPEHAARRRRFYEDHSPLNQDETLRAEARVFTDEDSQEWVRAMREMQVDLKRQADRAEARWGEAVENVEAAIRRLITEGFDGQMREPLTSGV